MQLNLSVQGVTDLLVTTSQLQHLGDFAADFNEVIPFAFQCFVDIFFLNLRPRQHLYGFRSISRLLHELPYLFHREAQYRRQHNDEVHEDFVHSGLCAAAFLAVCLVSIQTVFDDIQIEAGHFHGAEVVDCMIQHMEVIAFISSGNFLLQQLQMHQSPLVKLQHFVERNSIGFIIEIVGVAEDITDGVTDFAVNLSQLLEDFRGDTNICLIIRGCSPQTDDISAVLLDYILRNDNVAYRFGHFAAFAINYIAMSQYGFIRSTACNSNRGQQRGLEPAAMLVTAFEVHSNRPGKLRTLCSNSHVRGTAIEPYVHDVGFLMEVLAAAFRADSAFRQQLFSSMSPPCVTALFFEPVSNGVNSSLVNQMLAAVVAVEYRDRYAPYALTADAPVMTVANHVMNTLLAPGRNPLNIVDRFQCVITEAVDRSEPLRGCAENNRVFAAPAVCILVLDVLFTQQAVQLSQIFQYRDVGIEYKHALEAFASLFGQLALGVNRAENRQLIFQAGFKVDITMTRSGMYAAGTSFSGYIVSHNYERTTVVIFRERMHAFSVFHFFTKSSAKDIAEVLVASSANLSQQILCHKENFAFAFNPSIFQSRVQRNSNVRRHGPRSGGPNYHVSLFAFSSLRSLAVVFYERHFYEDGRSFLLAVFDFCFSQSGFAMRAPVNGFLALVDIAFVSHSTEHTNLLSLKAVMQSNVRIFPIAQNAQTFEILALDINPLQSEVMAFAAQSQRIQLITVQAQLFDSSMLNRHTVSIPAGNVRGVEALSIFIFHDDILQDFVQSMTHVDFAVCIRRAVMQNELFVASMQCLLFAINIVFFPEFQKIRFALRQACTHGELCFRQIQCFTIIHY